MRAKFLWLGVIVIVLGIMIAVAILQYEDYKFKIRASTRPSQHKASGVRIIPNAELNEAVRFDNGKFFVNPEKLDKIKPIPKVVYSFNVSNHKLVYRKKPKTTSIVIIGDSYAQGSGVKENETFGYFLANISNLSVVNLAHGGYATKQEVESLQKLGLDYKPDIVILQVAFNDYENPVVLYSLMEYVKSSLEHNNISFDDHAVSEEVYRFYNDEYYKKNADYFIEENIKKPLVLLGQLSKAYGFKVIVVKIPLPPNLERVFSTYSNNNSWVVLDLNQELGFEYKQPFVLSDIDWHFSKQTHKEVAQLLLNTIKNVS